MPSIKPYRVPLRVCVLRVINWPQRPEFHIIDAICLSLVLVLSPKPSSNTAISREDGEESTTQQTTTTTNNHHHHRHGNNHSNSKAPFNGYTSEEYLDRLEPNGNIPANKSDLGYGKREYITYKYVYICTYILYCTDISIHILLHNVQRRDLSTRRPNRIGAQNPLLRQSCPTLH